MFSYNLKLCFLGYLKTYKNKNPHTHSFTAHIWCLFTSVAFYYFKSVIEFLKYLTSTCVTMPKQNDVVYLFYFSSLLSLHCEYMKRERASVHCEFFHN